MQGLACPTRLSKGILSMQFAFVMVLYTLHSHVNADPTTFPSQDPNRVLDSNDEMRLECR
jgi:hypothetical protein